MNKRFRAAAIVMGLTGALVVGCAGQQEMMKPEPAFVITTPVVTLTKGTKVVMYGTGFAPKEVINIVLTDPNGGMGTIMSTAKPKPVADKDGMWATAWDITRFLRNLKPGQGTLAVSDKNYKPLHQAPIVFVAPPKKKKK